MPSRCRPTIPMRWCPRSSARWSAASRWFRTIRRSRRAGRIAHLAPSSDQLIGETVVALTAELAPGRQGQVRRGVGHADFDQSEFLARRDAQGAAAASRARDGERGVRRRRFRQVVSRGGGAAQAAPGSGGAREHQLGGHRGVGARRRGPGPHGQGQGHRPRACPPSSPATCRKASCRSSRSGIPSISVTPPRRSRCAWRAATIPRSRCPPGRMGEVTFARGRRRRHEQAVHLRRQQRGGIREDLLTACRFRARFHPDADRHPQVLRRRARARAREPRAASRRDHRAHR